MFALGKTIRRGPHPWLPDTALMLKLLKPRCTRCSEVGAHSEHLVLHINIPQASPRRGPRTSVFRVIEASVAPPSRAVCYRRFWPRRLFPLWPPVVVTEIMTTVDRTGWSACLRSDVKFIRVHSRIIVAFKPAKQRLSNILLRLTLCPMSRNGSFRSRRMTFVLLPNRYLRCKPISAWVSCMCLIPEPNDSCDLSG